jgi:4-hydroxythreonine-4-phosphate dehydrogenase
MLAMACESVRYGVSVVAETLENAPEMHAAPRIALVMGDPCGISAELAAKLLVLHEVRTRAAILVIGDLRVFARGAEIAKVRVDLDAVREPQPPRVGKITFLDLGHLDPAEIRLGEASAAGGRFAIANFTRGLALAQAGLIDAICFTPFNKQALRLGGNRHEDELQLAAEFLGHTGPRGEFNVLDGLWNARVTSHVPLARVAALLTVERIVEALAMTDQSQRAAGIAAPRIAVAGLNPHAGDGGNFGREEIDVIAPAVAAARARGIEATGPFPADTVFVRARDGAFDAVLTMYHDQGQIAMKLMGFERGVTVLGGLPVPIATPAHGTAYDIAGKGVANVSATLRAFEIACEMGRRAHASAAAAQ